ncbi:peroxiredoxin [Roseospira navarrensis]|uniref:Glutathione-dependent peroxiredoxin n=1 Tax=Roseospira navarrensis TaxID=140058 RepID=A0A7X1ZGT7_9PROT|nr:peroxiredoxin [Roseospira navarrensis]MQX37172.1 redoxin family protein [Roseospira navarrensis]
MIKVGDRIPEVTLHRMTDEGIRPITTAEVFAGKTVVLFAVPGAFTPTCSARHLPGFIDHIDALTAKGVDTVACIAVNDPFVMAAWGAQAGADGKVLMISDGNGAFAAATGTEMDASKAAMATRSQRYAMVVRDGVVAHVFLDSPGAFEASSAENVLAHL